MPTIGTLAYKIAGDSSQFERAMVATRKELREAGRLFAETRTPAERYAASLDRLNELARKGAVDQDLYNRQLGRLRERYEQTDQAAQENVSTVELLGTRGALVLAGVTASVLALQKAFSLAARAGRFLVDTVVDQLTEIDRIGKAAEKLNIAPRQLVGLAHAADLAGIGFERIDKGLQRLGRLLGDASAGAAEATKTFERLGINWRDLIDLPADRQFLAVAEAISQLDTQAERLSATVKVFDSEGAELVRILELGRNGLEAATAEAAKLGIAFDDLATKDAAAAVDALNKLDKAFTGLGRQLAIEVADPIALLVEDFTDLLTSANDLGPALDLAFSGALAAAILLAQEIEKIVTGIETLYGLGVGLSAVFPGAGQNLTAGIGGTRQAGRLFAGLPPDGADLGTSDTVNAFGQYLDQFFRRLDERRAARQEEIARREAARNPALAPGPVEDFGGFIDLITRQIPTGTGDLDLRPPPNLFDVLRGISNLPTPTTSSSTPPAIASSALQAGSREAAEFLARQLRPPGTGADVEQKHLEVGRQQLKALVDLTQEFRQKIPLTVEVLGVQI